MMAMAASPTPKAHNHPPYKQMILSAISTLKDRKGSSKTAIAKHIEANYKDLPSTHDALLSRHLQRLKKKGVLLMIKHSYKLNPEGGGLAMLEKLCSDVPKKRGRPPKNSTSGTGLVQGIEKKPGRPKKNPTQEGISLPTEKKKQGRPRKKVISVEKLILPKTMKSMLKVVRRKPGRPKKGSLGLESKAAPSIASGEKRKRGRPKKGSESALTSGEKRKPGRPKKGSLPVEPKLDSVVSSGEKRKSGRPKKVSSSVEPKLNSALSPGRPRKGSSSLKPKLDSALPQGEKRKPGRPKKGSSVFQLNPANITDGKRKPGRPKKGSDEPTQKKLAASVSSGEKKKRGRPKKDSTGIENDGRKRSGEPVQPKVAAEIASGEKRKRGRPKKYSTEMENDGGKAPLVPTIESSENALAVILAPTIVDGDLALAEDENNGGSSSLAFPEQPVEDAPLAEAPQGVTISGEKRKRGRPKTKRDGTEIPKSRPSVTKIRGRPPKTGNADAAAPDNAVAAAPEDAVAPENAPAPAPEETGAGDKSVGQLEKIVEE